MSERMDCRTEKAVKGRKTDVRLHLDSDIAMRLHIASAIGNVSPSELVSRAISPYLAFDLPDLSHLPLPQDHPDVVKARSKLKIRA